MKETTKIAERLWTKATFDFEEGCPVSSDGELGTVQKDTHDLPDHRQYPHLIGKFSIMQTMTRRTQSAICSYHFGAVALIALAITAYSTARAESSMVDLTLSPIQSNVMPTFGIGIYSLKNSGPGLYFNGSLSGDPDPYYSSNCYSCGSVTRIQQGSALFAIGATFPLVTSDMQVPIYRTLHTYVGLGYGRLSGYAQLSNSSQWLDYSSKNESGVNANGGFIFGFDGFTLNVGVNTLSKTVYFGIGVITDKK